MIARQRRSAGATHVTWVGGTASSPRACALISHTMRAGLATGSSYGIVMAVSLFVHTFCGGCTGGQFDG